MSSNCRHTDFEKIYSAFLSHYSKDPVLGESRYAEWVKFSGLDETQSYYLQVRLVPLSLSRVLSGLNFCCSLSKKTKTPILPS
jgi:hypothetical protein